MTRAIGTAVAVAVVAVVAVVIALVTTGGSSPTPLPYSSPTARPAGPMLGSAPTAGSQTFHLTWPDRVNVPPPVQGRIRLSDGRPVGFAYGGTGRKDVAEIRVSIGNDKPQWYDLAPGQSRALPGIPVTIKLTRLTPATGAQHTDTADLEVTVTRN